MIPFDQNHTFIKALSCEEILSVYTTHSVRHFPKAERKPVRTVRRMAEEGIYRGYGLYGEGKEESLLCYAFFTVLPGRRNILLDYFAVMEDMRSYGVGSLFLRQIKTAVTDIDGILLEVEDPDFAETEEEILMRNRRISFYEKNGVIDTGIRAKVFGVPYRVLYLSILRTPERRTLYDDFSAVYRRMVSAENYKTQVTLRLPQE